MKYFGGKTKKKKSQVFFNKTIDSFDIFVDTQTFYLGDSQSGGLYSIAVYDCK